MEKTIEELKAMLIEAMQDGTVSKDSAYAFWNENIYELEKCKSVDEIEDWVDSIHLLKSDGTSVFNKWRCFVTE